MKNQTILYGIIGFLAGSLVVLLLTKSVINNNMEGMMSMLGMRQNQMMQNQGSKMMSDTMHDSSMTMSEMAEDLKGKTGDDFDKTFMDLMIDHHQGAIDMANFAKGNANHQEIQDLADAIIKAQTSEIKMMRDWQKAWGYEK